MAPHPLAELPHEPHLVLPTPVRDRMHLQVRGQIDESLVLGVRRIEFDLLIPEERAVPIRQPPIPVIGVLVL